MRFSDIPYPLFWAKSKIRTRGCVEYLIKTHPVECRHYTAYGVVSVAYPELIAYGDAYRRSYFTCDEDLRIVDRFPYRGRTVMEDEGSRRTDSVH